MKKLFKANVQIVEVEPHSFCNRKCWFCPNSFIDRTGPVQHINPDVYSQLLDDLASIGYSETLCFAGWCEPFAYVTEFLQLVKQAKKKLPNALLMTNTNTDYFNSTRAVWAAEVGLQIVKAQLYFDEDEEYCEDAIREKMRKLQGKMPDTYFKEMLPLNWFALVNNTMVIVAYAKNFRVVGHNRCDMEFRKPAKRLSRCYEPIQMFGVNHDGRAVPCCNIRGDYGPHKRVLRGKMIGVPGEVFDLYEGAMIPEKQYPCSTCTFKEQPGKRFLHINIKEMYTQVIEEMKWQTAKVML